MAGYEDSVMRLIGLADFLEQRADFTESLNEFASLTANLLESNNCSIMLFYEEDESGARMKIYASHGYLPSEAFSETACYRQGIAGHVAATGKALIVPNIEKSPFASRARWPEHKSKCLLSAPIYIGRKVIGVINVNTPIDDRTFSQKDLFLLTTAALVVGKSIQTRELQNILRSRFAQLALLQETRQMVEDSLSASGQQPARLARIVGKAFYQEMNKAGFSNDQIISAATEVISLLGMRVRRYQNRLNPQEE